MQTSPAEQPSKFGGDRGQQVSTAPGTVLGNKPEATADAEAAPIDGGDVGALARRQYWESFTLAPGKYTLVLDARTHWVEITPSATGDVEIEAIRQPRVAGGAPTTSGAFLRLIRFGSSSARRVVLKREVTVGGAGGVLWSAAGAGASTDGVATVDNQRIWTPQGLDLILDRDLQGVYIQQTGRCVTHSMPAEPMSIGTQLGNQIDATGTQTARHLTGAEQGENIRCNTRQTVASASGTIDVMLAKDTTVLVIQSIGDVTLRTLGSDTSDGRWIEIEHERTSGSGFMTIPHNTAGTHSQFFNANQQPIVMGVGIVKVRSRSGFWRNNGGQSLIVSARTDGATLIGSTGGEYLALNDTPTEPAFRDSSNVTRRLLNVRVGWREPPAYDDFDGQVADGSNVLKREPWIAYSAPIITQNDAGAEHSINHPGQLRLALDAAAIADAAAIGRGPWDFATVRAFGARVKIPSNGGNELSLGAWGFGLVQDPGTFDGSGPTNGRIWPGNPTLTNPNITALVRSAGTGAGTWQVHTSGATTPSAAGSAVVVNTWYEIEARNEGGGVWRIYVNGVAGNSRSTCPTSGLCYFAIAAVKDAGAAGRLIVVDDCWIDPFPIDRRAA